MEPSSEAPMKSAHLDALKDFTPRQVVEALGEWGAQANRVSGLQLWQFLSALRGPDDRTKLDLKQTYTSRIRKPFRDWASHIGAMVQHYPDKISISEEEWEKLRRATIDSDVYAHFEDHLYFALLALEGWGMAEISRPEY